jgi:hypothetical protein
MGGRNQAPHSLDDSSSPKRGLGKNGSATELSASLINGKSHARNASTEGKTLTLALVPYKNTTMGVTKTTTAAE